MDTVTDPSSALYEADIVAWSRQQGAALRRVAAVERRHDDGIDLLADSIDGQPPRPSPDACPFSLDDLLATGD